MAGTRSRASRATAAHSYALLYARLMRHGGFDMAVSEIFMEADDIGESLPAAGETGTTGTCPWLGAPRCTRGCVLPPPPPGGLLRDQCSLFYQLRLVLSVLTQDTRYKRNVCAFVWACGWMLLGITQVSAGWCRLG